MALIDEPLPEQPVAAEAVIHVRTHLRNQIRAREGDIGFALQLLFGLEDAAANLLPALEAIDPIAAAADILADGDPSRVVCLGHDADHVERCRIWLLERKKNDATFEETVAFDLETLVALSHARDVANLKDRLSPNAAESPILITGETGTGKELLARGIQTLWAVGRQEPGELDALFVAGMPPEFVNDELFGHAKGAYTGAIKDRLGRLEAADGRCVLLDEVGDLSPDAQVRLLRFLDRGEVARSGDNKTKHVRVRVIAATLKDLDKETRKKRFRRDLLHRIGAVRLHLPPLRGRTHFEDVVRELIARAGHKAIPAITRPAFGALKAYEWPGNLRELWQVLNSALESAGSHSIDLQDLPAHVRQCYLQLPLEQRAADHICHATDQQPLTPVIAAHRSAGMSAAFEQADCPPLDGELPAIFKFLSSIPDSGADHVAVLARVQIALERQRILTHRCAVAQKWGAIVGAPLSAEVIDAVGAVGDNILAQRDAAVREFAEAYAALNLGQDPWWALQAQVRALPLFEGAPPDEIRAALHLAVKLLLSLPASFKEHMLAAIHARGIQGAWEVVSASFNNMNDQHEDGSMAAVDRTPAARRTRADWQEIASHETMAEAKRATGYSDTTIRAHLKKFGITAKWTRSKRSADSR